MGDAASILTTPPPFPLSTLGSWPHIGSGINSSCVELSGCSTGLS